MANSMEGQETIHSVCGPLAHSVADMRLFVTSVLSQEPWSYDSKVIPMPWRRDEEEAIKAKISSSGLTLGYYSCDGNVSFSLCQQTFARPLTRSHRFCLIHQFYEQFKLLSISSVKLGIQSILGNLISMHMVLVLPIASTRLTGEL
jgi:hypothetical protein